MSKSEWKEYTLDKVYDFSSGLSKSRKEFGFGYPFVTFKDVFYNYFIPSELSELANTSEKEQLKCSVKRGDVFLTRTSETMDELGKSSVALRDYPNATFNGFTKRLRPNGEIEIHPEYAGYYFRSPRFRAEVNSMATMTTRASLNNEMMSKLKIVVPSMEEQKLIAQILIKLDEKLEINNKINDNLEKIAQTIFKQWFVDFEFSNEDGEPYKSSGGEMVESEMGMIPKGWKVGNISELGYIQSGYAFKSKSLIDQKTKYKIIKIKNISSNKVDMVNTQYITRHDFEQVNNKFILNDGEVIVAMTGAELGKTGIVTNDDWISLLNQRVGVIRSKENVNRNYLNKIFLSKSFQQKLNDFGYGSAQPNISTSDIESICINIPSEGILKSFYELTKGIHLNQVNLEKENRKLTHLRNILLPKLMSGEIRVNDIRLDI